MSAHPRFAIVTSRFNEEVTSGLKKGALAYLREKDIQVAASDQFDAPGAFDTAHFEFISLGATVGLMQAMLSTSTPISFGILTTYNDEQAEKRSQDNAENKGREAAAACYETAMTLRKISEA